MRSRVATVSFLAALLAVFTGLHSISCGGRVLATDDAGAATAPQAMSGGASSGPAEPPGGGDPNGAGGSGGPLPSNDGDDAGVDASFDASFVILYDRLGQHAGIAALVKDAFENAAGGILTDPKLVSYFYIRTGGYAYPFGLGGNGGAPSLDVVEACFTDLMANAAGGPEQYPMTEQGFTCRDMHAAHAGLGITASAFQRFVSLMAARFAANGVSNDDLMTLGGALLGTQSDIVDAPRVYRQMDAGVDANMYGAYCGAIDGGVFGCNPYD